MARGLGTLQQRVAVVTGAASGIGRATAFALADRGALLGLCDTDAPRLGALGEELGARGARAITVRADVTRPEDMERFAAAVAGLGPPALLVNNAGVLVLGGVLDTSLEDWSHVIDVNLKGAVNACRAFLPPMLAAKRGGHVVNVASASAFFTQSELAAYGATKHALVGLSQALADELAPHGIGVSIVLPGFVTTNILERARIGGARPEEARRAAHALLRWRRLSAERVAERVVLAAERGQAIVPVGIEARVLALFSRSFPAQLGGLIAWARKLRERT